MSKTASERAQEPIVDANLSDETVDTAEVVWAALGGVIDPEVGLDIVTMGLVYSVEVWPDGSIQVEMTLTTRGCPMGSHIVGSAEMAVRQALPGRNVIINLVWSPEWSPSMISPDALKELRRRV